MIIQLCSGLRRGTAAAHIGEIPEKGSPVESRVSVKPQFFRDNIERCGFSGTVSAAENRYRFKVNRLQPPVGKNPEGVKRIIAVYLKPEIYLVSADSPESRLSYVHDGLFFISESLYLLFLHSVFSQEEPFGFALLYIIT